MLLVFTFFAALRRFFLRVTIEADEEEDDRRVLDDSFALFDISDAIDTNYKFVGAATADDGRVVFVPHHYYTFGVGVFTLPPERMTTPLFRRPCSATGRVRRIAWGSTWVAPRTRFRTP